MIKLKDIALELLEYKVKDLLAKRPFSGGMASVLELTSLLRQRTLSSDQQLRFDKVSRALERHATGQESAGTISYHHIKKDDNSDPTKAADSTFNTLGAEILGSGAEEESQKDKESQGSLTDPFSSSVGKEDKNDSFLSLSNITTSQIPMRFSKGEKTEVPLPPLSKAEKEEQISLRRLAQKVWWKGLKNDFRHLANAYRGESSRRTVRLLYGLLRNLEIYSKNQRFANDVTGKFFKVAEAIPDYDHPFLPLNNVEGISELLLNVVEVMLTFKAKNSPYKDLSLSQKEILPYLKHIALNLARDPYAGKMGMMDSRGLNSQQIQSALSELDREKLGEAAKYEQKHKLEERLKDAIKFEDAQRDLFKQDIIAYRIAAENVFGMFASCLPKQIGGNASTPKLQGGVFLGKNPTISLSSPPENARTLTLCLKGSTRFKLAGLDFAVVSAGDQYSFYADGLELPLNPYINLKLRNKKVESFLEENYLHIKVQDDFRTLSELVAEGLTVQFILELRRRDAAARILEGITGIAVEASVQAAGQAVREISDLCSRASQPQETLFQLLQNSAQIHTPNASDKLIQGLGHYLYHNINAPSTPIFTLVENYHLSKDQVNVYGLGKKPLSINFGGSYLSIRKRSFPGEVYQAMRLGKTPSVSLTETLEENEELEGLVVTAHEAMPKAFYDYMIYHLKKGKAILARSSKELATVYLPN